MTGKTFTYLCTILCYIVIALLVSDVNAKAYKSSHSSHSSSHASHSYPSSHGGFSGSHKRDSYSKHGTSSYSTHRTEHKKEGGVTQHKYPSSTAKPSKHRESSGHHSTPRSVEYPASTRAPREHQHPSGGSSHPQHNNSSINIQHNSSRGSQHIPTHITEGISQHKYPSSTAIPFQGGSSGRHSNHSSSGNEHNKTKHGYLSPNGRQNVFSGIETTPRSVVYPASTKALRENQHLGVGSSHPQQNNSSNNIQHYTSWGSQQIPTHITEGISQHKYPSSTAKPSQGGSSGHHSNHSSSGHKHNRTEQGYSSTNRSQNEPFGIGTTPRSVVYPASTRAPREHQHPSGGSSHPQHNNSSINIQHNSSRGSQHIPTHITEGISQHKYPSSTAKPSQGGSSGRLSNHSSSGNEHNKTKHVYPSPNGTQTVFSGIRTKPRSVIYPASTGAPQGNHHYYPQQANPNIHHNTGWGSQHIPHTNSHTVLHHHDYSYRPPSVIHYQTSSGLVSYPVYTGSLPPCVYEYRSSRNKYRSLLAGLALYNLGRMSSDPRMHSYHQQYVPLPDEFCKFGVRHRSGDTEEMAVDCRSITYFIYEVNQPGSLLSAEMNKNMQQANALVNANQQQATELMNTNTQVLSSSGVLMQGSAPVNTITTTTTQTYSVTDSRFYESPIDFKPDMECYVSRVAKYSNIVKPVPCDLLQSYSKQSLHRRNSAPSLKFSFVAFVVSIAYLLY